MTGFTLPGMMLEPGCVSGSASSAMPARGPMPISRMSEAIFQRPSAIVRSAPWAAMTASSAAWAWKWLAASRTCQTGQRGEADAGPERVLGMGVDPGPDGGSAERHGEQFLLGGTGSPDRFLDLARVAAELLAEPDRRRVLEVGPAGLDDRPELLGLGGERRVEPLEGRDQLLLDRHRGRELERRRDRVVRALAAVDVVVGVDLRPPPSRAAARWATTSFMFVLVDVPGAGLVDVDRELVVVAPRRRPRGRPPRSPRRHRRRAGRARRSSRRRPA